MNFDPFNPPPENQLAQDIIMHVNERYNGRDMQRAFYLLGYVIIDKDDDWYGNE